MKTDEIRETFLSYFEGRDHRRVASAPLIPSDPTLLLNIAGMVPFKPFFLGDAEPPAPRMTSAQKCVRTNDIENVGRTTRHLTFFEMLGNFSFGDYFKREAIRWAWELSTEYFGLDPERIWVTVYEDDQESIDLWLEETGGALSRDRIQRMGAADNYWWTHNAGPGGPCSELYYDRGPAWGEAGGPAANDERYLEYYNLVFMQDQLDDERNVVSPLPAQNVDTGLGIERLAVILQDVRDVFETDVFRALLDEAGRLTGATYGRQEASDLSLRIIAEHARAATFLIADGVLPSKEGRGYVLRRLVRRVVRHARLLGSEAAVLPAMVAKVIEVMGAAYPELPRQRELVTRVVTAEEEDFSRVIAGGLERLDEVVREVRAAGGTTLPGDATFELHDTFGFPLDLTAEIAQDVGLSLDRERFDELMQAQRERARAAARKGGGGVGIDVYREAAQAVGATEFLGYESLEGETSIGALVTAAGLVGHASEGDELEVVLPRTPFYAEGGGQVGDAGVITTETGRLEVLDTQEAVEGVSTHRVRVVAGEVGAGQGAQALVDPDRRVATARSHSATHVLHATIKEVLGEHAQQAGSLVQPGRLRFDFPHFEAVSADALAQIEATVNERVLANPYVTTEVMGIDAAREAGAVANFGDKYGHTVRVVTIGDFSKELCGGTHVPEGAVIGSVHVVREESIGSNTRRVEALTGVDAYRHAAAEMVVAQEVGRLLGVRTDEAIERVRALMASLRAAEKSLAEVRRQQLLGRAGELVEGVQRDAAGVAVVTAALEDVGADDLRAMANDVKGRLGRKAVVVLGTRTADGKAQLICTVTGDLVEAGVEARPILHPAARVVGGGAGGKGDLAQAGGKDGSRLEEALRVAEQQARDATAG